MGSAASKPAGRTLGSAVKSETKVKLASPKGKVNTLPSKELKEKFATSQNKDTSFVESDSFRGQASTTTFNPAHLKKKLKKKEQQQTTVMPEGKDGFDPQGPPSPSSSSQMNDGPNSSFADSVMRLGAQIQSHSTNPNLNPEFAALKQLSNRRRLYLQGEQEEERATGSGSGSSSGSGSRTMIHPRTLAGLLNDLNDSRISRPRLLEDYQLQSDEFLDHLQARFKLATTMLVEKEKPRDGEVMVQNRAPSSGGVGSEPSASPKVDENGQLREIDPEKMQRLKSRLGLDEEVSPEERDIKRR
ncbi:hypothetical protein CAAN1_08S00430 [[Candida] anglica]|uniref:Ribosome biogenesis protein SLX9 n=1 Tax=[Candida] anglica TaxID=148631 RepID=A0ABP0E860_9ASCO